MKKIIVTALVLSFSGAFAAKPSEESVRLLMQKVGAGQLGVQVMKQMIPGLKQMVPNAPNEFWDDVMKEATPEGLVNQVIPIYQKYLTQEDVNSLSAFYDTEVGKKMISVQPMIARESMIAGQKWGQSLAQNVFTTYKERYGNQSKVEDTKVEDTKVEDTKVEDTKVEDTKVEDTKVEDTKVEDTKVEDTKVEDTKS
ncbi:MAG: DUF2059 domain-containing protein [Gammaproteobacteria bacterium]|nr:DUF2059 domain-containing protein [Gammaproteobacteria bacterium]